MDAKRFFTDHVEEADIIHAGFLKGLGDTGGGIVALLLSLLVICMSLFCMVKLLHSLILGRAKAIILKATNMNDYLAMALGGILTFIVQSSSVVTSALTPLCGIGVLPVHKMLPMTLGANIGTTFTALLAALAVPTHDSLQIAFCHLPFNILGIIVWFPLPPMRRIVVNAAKMLGFYASYWRLVPLLYILVMFLAVPGLCLAISVLYGASLAAGIVCSVLDCYSYPPSLPGGTLGDATELLARKHASSGPLKWLRGKRRRRRRISFRPLKSRECRMRCRWCEDFCVSTTL